MRSILLAFAALVLLTVPARADNPLLVSDVDFAPYSMLIDNTPAGIDVDVMKEAARRAGIALDLQLQPLGKGTEMILKGKCDGAFSYFKNPKREEYAMYMEAVPVHFSDYVLFTKVGNQFAFRTYEDLKGKILGRVEGTDLGREFAEAQQSGTVQVNEYPDLTAGLKALIMGEIDAYAGNIDVAYYRLKTMGMTSSIVYLPKKIVTQKPAYLVMSRATKLKDREVIFQSLERELDRMRKDGSYNKIARKYLIRY